MSQEVKSPTPPKQLLQKNAQMAAELDNYKSAIDRLSQATQIALNTNENISILKKLYPNKHIIKIIHLKTTPQGTYQRKLKSTLKSSIKSLTEFKKERQQALLQTYQT